MIVPRFIPVVIHRGGCPAGVGRCAWFFAALTLMLSSIFLVSCTGLFGNTNATGVTATPTASQLPLAKLHWCSNPSMVFRDEGATTTPVATATVATTPGATVTATASSGSTPTSTATASPTAGGPRTISDWSQVEPYLGFTLYLPATLPGGSCLVSAQATIHDPIFGGNFFIGYLLPDHSSISLSEAPLNSQNTQFQCNPTGSASPQAGATPKVGAPTPSASPVQAANQLCSGAREMTNIVLLARGTIDSLQRFFNALQPNVTWIPGS
jgi:hypothetical protein